MPVVEVVEKVALGVEQLSGHVLFVLATAAACGQDQQEQGEERQQCAAEVYVRKVFHSIDVVR